MPERVTVYLNDERARRLKQLRRAMAARSKGMVWSAAKIFERAFDLAYDAILEEAYQGADFIESAKSRLLQAEQGLRNNTSPENLNEMALDVRAVMQEIIQKQRQAGEESRFFKECIRLRQRALLLEYGIIEREHSQNPHAGLRRAEVAIQIERLRRRIGPIGVHTRQLVIDGRPGE